MPLPDASHSTTKVFEKSSNAKTGDSDNARFKFVNAASESLLHVKPFLLSMLVNGAAMLP